jgi:gamma-glutamyltranspeptidase/glutathione hydrolase
MARVRAAAIHYTAEVMRRFSRTEATIGRSDFVKVPVKGLLDPAYIRQRRASIDPDHATPSDRLNPGRPAGAEGSETTHYSIVDAEGNAVAVTYTLNNGYGSGVTAPGLGFLLNDEMDDFTVKPGVPNLFGLVGGEANAIQPRKRPLSAMTPTIVLRRELFCLICPATEKLRCAQVFPTSPISENIQIRGRPRSHHQEAVDGCKF